MRELTCLIIFIALATLLAVIMIITGFICQYKNETKMKNTAYECGLIPIGNARVKFDIKYFNYAILFLIFDIETIFLYPFALSINSLGFFVIIEAFLFVAILLFGLFFAIKQDLLRWT